MSPFSLLASLLLLLAKLYGVSLFSVPVSTIGQVLWPFLLYKGIKIFFISRKIP